MKRRTSGHLVTVLLLASVACGGEDVADAESSPAGDVALPGAAGLDTLDEQRAESYREALQALNDAMDETRSMVQTADTASDDELEAAMSILNVAFLRGRAEVIRVRGSELPDTDELIAELREQIIAVHHAFDALLAHHPDPSPEMLDLGDD